MAKPIHIDMDLYKGIGYYDNINYTMVLIDNMVHNSPNGTTHELLLIVITIVKSFVITIYYQSTPLLGLPYHCANCGVISERVQTNSIL